MHASSRSPHDPASLSPPHGDSQVDSHEQPQALRLVADVLGAVRAHWRVAALFFVVANAAVLAGIMLCPRSYVSEAKFRVNPGRETASLDPSVTAGSNQISLSQTNREQDLNTAVDVLNSRAVLAYAVRRIGPEPILEGYVPAEDEVADDVGDALDPEAARIDPGPLAALGLSDPVSRFEKAVQAVGEMMEVISNKKSDVISVSVEAEKPALAQRICAEIVAGFRQKYTDASEIEGSSEFFAEKADEAKADLDRTAALLAEELNALGISTVEGRRQQLQEELSRLSAEEMDRRKALEGTLAEVAGYERVLADTPQTIDAGKMSNPATGAPDTLRKEIADLEARREKIVRETSAKAPGAVRLEREIAAAERLLEDLTAESDQTTTAANPVWQDLTKSRLTAQAKAEGLRAELAAIRSQLDAARQAVAELNERESRILALQTERDESAKSLAKYVQNRELTKVADEMGAQRISSVNVFQEPTFSAKPVAPKKRLIALAGLVFAGFGALGLCLALEYRRVFFPDGHDVSAAAHAGNGWADPSAVAAPAAAAGYGGGNGRPAPAFAAPAGLEPSAPSSLATDRPR
ncbi:GumC family protein [Alienimonas sp. DA493]|uniref:GumC family protein n=1 Tax=Alienimonas sp. DA493 TaxID=3373605 RepID=UPI0037544231